MAMGRIARGGALLLALVALATGTAPAQDRAGERWVAAWATSQQIPEPHNALPVEALQDATLRQIVRIQIGGQRLRVRFSNAFGTAPLELGAATLARALDPASSAVDPKSVTALRFSGKPGVTIPAGADIWSDPFDFAAPAGTDLAISIYLPKAPAQQTGHPGSRATSYTVHGDATGAATLENPATVDHWYQIAGIETVSAQATAFVALGDSITDGSRTFPNTNKRWTDFFQARLRATSDLNHVAVLNAGIGGNRLLLDGLGPNALARFDRDVLSPPGVTHLLILEGVNDLGTFARESEPSAEEHAAHTETVIDGLRQLVARARAHGIVAIGGTILPFAASNYYHPSALTEADRQRVNAFIRTPGNFDAVVDFDAAMRDPARPAYLRADLDSGDGIHPSIAGYELMGGLIPLDLLRSSAAPGPAIALTFDDLPVHSALPPGMTHDDVARQIAAALNAADAPAYGFINGAQTLGVPGSEAVLDTWRAAGLPLGNHGWAHLGFSKLTDDQFAEQLAKNEPLLEKHMAGQDWHWFRYPFLDEGKDDAARARGRALLAAKGYKVAPVTMSFADYAYNEPYARCMAKGDYAAIRQLEQGWLAGAEADMTRARAMAQALYGRDIPYVLLMHLGAFDARMLPQLLALYKRNGFRFVSLPEAVADPYYADAADPSLPAEPQSLDARMWTIGKTAPAPVPVQNMDSLCR